MKHNVFHLNKHLHAVSLHTKSSKAFELLDPVRAKGLAQTLLLVFDVQVTVHSNKFL
jgi:hypothetical protein